jgi:tRNA-Thr(GGU) m(6)t(6)A37 methyltransferase TsaA
MNAAIHYQPIGVIHTPFSIREGMPIQPTGASGIKGTVEVFPEFQEGLRDIEGFSHIILIYHFHRVSGSKLLVTPFLDSQLRGVFATRAPTRPNPIGMSTVKLRERKQNILYIENVDILDGTPLLDIKPYVPDCDLQPTERIGWLERAKGKVSQRKSDDRFK